MNGYPARQCSPSLANARPERSPMFDAILRSARWSSQRTFSACFAGRRWSFRPRLRLLRCATPAETNPLTWQSVALAIHLVNCALLCIRPEGSMGRKAWQPSRRCSSGLRHADAGVGTANCISDLLACVTFAALALGAERWQRRTFAWRSYPQQEGACGVPSRWIRNATWTCAIRALVLHLSPRSVPPFAWRWTRLHGLQRIQYRSLLAGPVHRFISVARWRCCCRCD